MMTLDEFEALLKQATKHEQLNKALSLFLKSCGISTFSFTYYNYYPNSQNKIKYDICSPNFLIWHQHYLSEGYEDVDSTLESVYQTNLPIHWELKEQLKNAKTIREYQMRLDSIKFGAEKGVCIPIHGPHEDFSSLLLVQMQGENCLEQWENLKFYFFNAAHYYYVYVKKSLLLSERMKSKNKLSTREVQCLKLIAKQYSTPKIANFLNITERTVNYHIQRLNKKLGTKNKYQSVIKALQKDLISF